MSRNVFVLVFVVLVAAAIVNSQETEKCGPNEVLSKCGPICNSTCRNPNGEYCRGIVCWEVPRCICKAGTGKVNDQGPCIDLRDCPKNQ